MTIDDPKFEITKDILDRCFTFANDSVGTSTDRYARRGQMNPLKIRDDIRNGKIGEEAVWEKVSKLYPNLSKPDLGVYSKKEKNWDPDLKDTESSLRIGVKTQDYQSELDFSRSWVFQFGNGGKFDCDTGIFGKELDSNHYVCFVSVNVPKRIGELRALVKVQWLHDKKLFKEMKNPNLRGNKVAVYYEDLEKYSDQLWQL